MRKRERERERQEQKSSQVLKSVHGLSRRYAEARSFLFHWNHLEWARVVVVHCSDAVDRNRERERERERGEFFNEKSISRRRMIFEQLSLSFVKEKEKKLAT